MATRSLHYAGICAVATLVLALSACGGGGSGPGPVTSAPTPPSPTPPSPPRPPCVVDGATCLSVAQFEVRRDNATVQGSTSEWAEQSGLATINARDAHAALVVKYGAAVEPGDGVTVAVLDSGVDSGHGELDDATITETFLQNLPDETRSDFGTGEYSHGTAVTSVIAAQPNDAGFLGLAWGASFKVFTVPIGSHLAEDDPRRNTFDWEAAYRAVLASGADIVNASYGFPGTIIEDYTVNDLRTVTRFGPPLQVVAQRGVANPTIFVWLAGNSHGDECEMGDAHCVADSSSSTGYSFNATSPEPEGGAVAKLPELRGHTVVVAALGTDGKIADYSNRCGIAASWCITAPGTNVSGAEFGPDAPPPGTFYYRTGLRGTSFATPMVSGGLALMKHFFRSQLSNRELVTRLFATADKSGDYATSSIYGQGLMDLGAAVSPVGSVRVAAGTLVSTFGHDIQTTQLRLGEAFGDSLLRAVAGREIAAFDSLDAPFWFDLAPLIGAPQPPSALTRLRGLALPVRNTHRPAARATGPSGWRVGFGEPPVRAESSLLNLAGDAATVTFATRDGLELSAFDAAAGPGQHTGDAGALLAWRPPGAPLALRVGWLGEGNTVLGSTATGAFGRLAADNIATGLEAATALGGWSLGVETEFGLVAPRAGGGLIDSVSPLTTSATSLRAERRLTERDGIVLSLSQPLRVESGSATLTLPVGRTWDGTVLDERFEADLAPSARQVDLSARWQRADLLGGALQVEAAAAHNPGHVAARPAYSLLAGWRAAF